MTNEELNNSEQMFIEMIRTFKFLFDEGFHGENFSIGSREPGIKLHNAGMNRSVYVYWSEAGYLDIQISRKKFFASGKYALSFSVRDFYDYFNYSYLKQNPPIGTYNQLESNVRFVQKHLMPIILGQKWIDEVEKA